MLSRCSIQAFPQLRFVRTTEVVHVIEQDADGDAGHGSHSRSRCQILEQHQLPRLASVCGAWVRQDEVPFHFYLKPHEHHTVSALEGDRFGWMFGQRLHTDTLKNDRCGQRNVDFVGKEFDLDPSNQLVTKLSNPVAWRPTRRA